MKLLSVFVVSIEYLIPLLILFPYKNGKLRGIAFLLILLLHLGIGLSLYVGLFYIINIVVALALIPSTTFDKIESKFKLVRSEQITSRLKEVINGNIFKIFGNAICLFVILISLIVNLSTLSWFQYELSDTLQIPVNSLRLNQNWAMFSPGILKKEGWYVYYGMDSIGRQWDLKRNEDYVNFEKPKNLLHMHKNDRWRKLTENMQRNDMYFLRPLFCKYQLKNWNKKHSEKKLFSLTLYYLERETLTNYQYSEPERKVYCLCDSGL
jgi:hypothetical protein